MTLTHAAAVLVDLEVQAVALQAVALAAALGEGGHHVALPQHVQPRLVVVLRALGRALRVPVSLHGTGLCHGKAQH
eukprot:scaffold114349_cov42-Phaeocystis_antarctica.AAC.1